MYMKLKTRYIQSCNIQYYTLIHNIMKNLYYNFELNVYIYELFFMIYNVNTLLHKIMCVYKVNKVFSESN